jgi:3-dehydroquinate synthase
MASLRRINLVEKVDSSYDIVIGRDLFDQIAKEIWVMNKGRPIIITDSNVKELWANQFGERIQELTKNCGIFSFEAGEKSKTLSTCEEIINQMSRSGLGRDTLIIALGGGVTGDLAGFIAANFCRGVPYVQIPTTIVAQADSSVGGKTAVDTKYGKNLLGAFKHPEKVWIDVNTIGTLPMRHLIAGMAETIKHAIIADKDFFDYLDKNSQAILDKDFDALEYIAGKNCEIKGRVVEQDPKEKGLRRILNYGHTIGHAVEHLSGYEILHGEAVAMGMEIAAHFSKWNGGLSRGEVAEQKRLLQKYGLPTRIPKDISYPRIIDVTLRDKKAKDGRARYCLPAEIGKMMDFEGEYVTPISSDIVEATMAAVSLESP